MIEHDERVMYFHVLFYLTAVAKVASTTGRCLWLEYEAIHQYYPLYAKLMNAPSMYSKEVAPGKYHAVSVFFMEEEKIAQVERTVYVPLMLREMNQRYHKIIDVLGPEDRIRTLESARSVCKCLYSGWDWDSINLTA